MRVRGRSVWFDYIGYRFFLDRTGSALFVAGFLLLVVAAWLDLAGWTALPGLSLVVAGLQHALDIRQHGHSVIRFLGRPRRRCRLRPSVRLASQERSVVDFEPSSFEANTGFRRLTVGGEAVLSSELVNNWLLTGDCSITIDTFRRRRIADRIRSKREKLTELLALKFYESRTDGKDFRNESKLCLSSDISASPRPVRCFPGGYYDAFLTNEAPLLSIYEPSTNREVVDFGELFPGELDTDGILRLKSIAASDCANAIGVSTLGFTDDGRMVVWEQSETAQQSEGYLAPSGSGSLDYSDLDSASFHNTIAFGMERELREECSEQGTILASNEVGDTVVIGFFRWVRRSGKPEFCGISRIFRDSSEIRPDYSEVHDVADRSLFFPAADVDAVRASIDVLGAKPNLSAPLSVTLSTLRDFIDKNPSRFASFLADRRTSKVLQSSAPGRDFFQKA